MIHTWFNGLTGIAKLGLILAIITSVGGLVHYYNQGLIDQGKAEVTLEWIIKTEAEREKLAAAAAKMEAQKAAIAKKYQTERTLREKLQQELSDVVDDVLKNAATAASTTCLNDRLQQLWNDTSRGTGPSDSEAGRSVAPTVR